MKLVSRRTKNAISSHSKELSRYIKRIQRKGFEGNKYKDLEITTKNGSFKLSLVEEDFKRALERANSGDLVVRSCTYGTVSASRKLNNSDKQNKMNYFSKPRTSISYDDCTIINKKWLKCQKT